MMAKKKTEDAKSCFAQAAQEEKALGYREPPLYIRPVGETEAAALMAVATGRMRGRLPEGAGGAAAVRVSIVRHGDEQRASRRRQAATAEYSNFVEAWKDADPDLPQLAHARSFLAEHARVADRR